MKLLCERHDAPTPQRTLRQARSSCYVAKARSAPIGAWLAGRAARHNTISLKIRHHKKAIPSSGRREWRAPVTGLSSARERLPRPSFTPPWLDWIRRRPRLRRAREPRLFFRCEHERAACAVRQPLATRGRRATPPGAPRALRPARASAQSDAGPAIYARGGRDAAMAGTPAGIASPPGYHRACCPHRGIGPPAHALEALLQGAWRTTCCQPPAAKPRRHRLLSLATARKSRCCMCAGLGEWRNIQDIVRVTFKAFHDVLCAQGDAIRKLERVVDAKASRAELATALAAKASAEDLAQKLDMLEAHTRERLAGWVRVPLLQPACRRLSCACSAPAARASLLVRLAATDLASPHHTLRLCVHVLYFNLEHCCCL